MKASANTSASWFENVSRGSHPFAMFQTPASGVAKGVAAKTIRIIRRGTYCDLDRRSMVNQTKAPDVEMRLSRAKGKTQGHPGLGEKCQPQEALME